MIKYLQLPFRFDVAALQHDVQGLDAAPWKMHYQVLHYEGEWSAIPLRSIEGRADNIMISPLDGTIYSDTEFLTACPYIKSILQQFPCELMAVRLLKLNAGAIIKEHRDSELSFENGEIRLHIPVITHELVAFYLDNEQVAMKEGECWYMNFNLPHSISNNSPVNRVHLVIDAKVNDWVKDLFAGDAIIKRKDVAETDLVDDATKKLMIAQFRLMDTVVAHELADKLEKELHHG